MKKNKTILNKKLKSYSALAASVVAITGTVNAQVIYTDIVDYTSISNSDTYSLDLDNDGTKDFDIYTTTTASSGNTYSTVGINPLGSNRVMSSNSFAAALNVNSNIASSNAWTSGANRYMAYREINSSFTDGPWIGVSDKYLGLEFVSGGNTYYGWARLDVNKLANAFTIKDYAYNKTAGKSILAGDKGNTTYTQENTIEGFSAFSYERKLTIKLDNFSGTIISVKNVLGQEVKSVVADDKITRVDLGETPTGIYFVTVTKEGKTATAKVYIQ